MLYEEFFIKTLNKDISNMTKIHQFNQILDQVFKFVSLNFEKLAEIRIN